MKKTIKAFVFVLAGLFVLYTFYLLWRQAQPQPVVYRIVTPQLRTIENRTLASGTLESRTKVELKPQVTGRVEELYVTAGQKVKSGDLVARVKVIPDMSSLNLAQNAVETARLNLEEVQREALRTQRLFEQGVVSREENEKSQNVLASAKEAYTSAQCQIDVITKGFSSRSGVVNTTEVRSSMDGVVLDVPVKVGTSVSGSSLFSPGSTIASVGDMTDVIFVGAIDELDVAKLRVGMEALLVPGSMPDVRIPSVLEFIAPESRDEGGTKMFEIKAAVTSVDGIELRSGYSANADIILQKAENVISIDEACVCFEDGEPYVYQLTSAPADSLHQTFTRRSVELGLSDGLYVEILKGVSPDMKLRGNLK